MAQAVKMDGELPPWRMSCSGAVSGHWVPPAWLSQLCPPRIALVVPGLLQLLPSIST